MESDSMTEKQEPYRADLRGPAIVVRGSVLTGFTFYGPFPTIEEAIKWCITGTLAGVSGIDDCVVCLLESRLGFEHEQRNATAEDISKPCIGAACDGTCDELSCDGDK